MKQIFLFVLLLLSGVAARAQNVDSLVNVLNTQKLTVDEQMTIYSKICQVYVYNEPDKVVEYAQKGLALAEKMKDKVRASKFNDDFGKAYLIKGKSDTALIYFNISLDLAKEAKDKEQEACVYLSLGVLYRNQSNLTTALEYYMKSLPIYESTGNKKNITMILGNIGSIHRTLSNPERALYYLKQAEVIADPIDNPLGTMNTYFELGCIYMGMGEDEKGLDYLQKVNEIARKTGNKGYEAAGMQAMGEYYLEVENYDKAIECANECLRIGKIMGSSNLIIGSYSTLSQIYAIQGNWKECEATAYEAWETDSTDMHNIPGILYNLISANIHLDNKDKAINFLSNFYDLFMKKNDENLHKILMDAEGKYETEKKEIRITALEKERELYVWLGIAGFLLVTALIIVLWQTKRNVRKEKQLIAARSVMDGEMRERTRLAQDLHDRLSGNISAAKIELANHAGNLHDVSEKLDSCIEEIRRVAHNLMPVSLQAGLKIALVDYTAKFPNVRFHFFGEGKPLDKRTEYIVYCCAAELVNNSLKHSGAKNINVQLVRGEDYVALTVEDDGCGFDEKSVIEGIGLKSIRDRIASCGGKMNIVSSRGKGTEIIIEIKTK